MLVTARGSVAQRVIDVEIVKSINDIRRRRNVKAEMTVKANGDTSM